MGIETLQKAALAAGFAMATPDDTPPVEDIAPPVHEPFRQTGQWLVPVASAPHHHSATRESFATALAWLKNHLPMAGSGRAPA